MLLKAQNALVNSCYCVTERISCTITAVDLNVCGSGMIPVDRNRRYSPLPKRRVLCGNRAH